VPGALDCAREGDGQNKDWRTPSIDRSDATDEYWNLEDISDEASEEASYDPTTVNCNINDRVVDYLMLQACRANIKKRPDNSGETETRPSYPSRLLNTQNAVSEPSRTKNLKHRRGNDDGEEEE